MNRGRESGALMAVATGERACYPAASISFLAAVRSVSSST
jgi:hypothetical protein